MCAEHNMYGTGHTQQHTTAGDSGSVMGRVRRALADMLGRPIRN